MTKKAGVQILLSVLLIFLFMACSGKNSNQDADDENKVLDSESSTNKEPDSDDSSSETSTDSNNQGSDSGTDSEVVEKGECNTIPPANEEGFLWFSGYEEDPWDSKWGLLWSQVANHSIVTNGVLFGKRAAQVTYPAGSFSSEGGAQYRMDFSLLEPVIEPAEELYVRYYVKFDENTDFVRGGKLPGLMGGSGNTGGDRPTGFDGWSGRIMWRDNGRVVQYLYYPDQGGTYADDLDWNYGGSARFFIPGKWHCVETYIKMNTVTGSGQENALYDGVVRSWFDGELALERDDIRFRYTNDFSIDGFYFSTFYGGGDASWAPLKDELVMFDNFVLHSSRIGCHDECIIPSYPEPGPVEVVAQETHLVYNGEEAAWGTGAWSGEGSVKDFNNAQQNHTPGGSASAYISFSSTDWDAAVFTSSAVFDPNDYTHLRMLVMPEELGVIFRVQFRGNENSEDVTVDGSYVYQNNPWEVGKWVQITIPISAFSSLNGQNSLLIRSASNTPSSAFWVDDIELIVAQ